MKLSDKFSIAAVASVLTKFLMAGVTVTLAHNSLTFGTIDSLTIAAILTPILGAHHLGSYIEGNKTNVDKN